METPSRSDANADGEISDRLGGAVAGEGGGDTETERGGGRRMLRRRAQSS